MIKQVTLAIVALFSAGQILAMPSKAELDKVSPVVQELMKPIHDEMKSGKKTRSEVADAAMELVAQAESEAAKFLLIKGAYGLYVRDGNFDAALSSLQTLQTVVSDVPAQNLANIIESSLRTVPKKNGGQLYRLLDETKTIAKYQDALKRLATEVKRDPKNKALQTILAEHQAVLGNWNEALKAFASSDNKKASEAAKAEQSGAKSKKAIADFWWSYPGSRTDLQKSFHQHAAELYAAALAANEVTGLYKTQVEKRIAEAKALGAPAIAKPAEDLGGVQLWENGPYWAECNVGATKPEEAGYYFWWGDTVGYKRVGDRWDAADGPMKGFDFKEANSPTYAKDNTALLAKGYVDAVGNLVSMHDAATAHIGAQWRMPTDADFAELIKNCDTEWTTHNGVIGRMVVGKGAYAAKRIFLPASGYAWSDKIEYVGKYGYYWSSRSDPNDAKGSFCLDLSSFAIGHEGRHYGRYIGRNIRAVRDSGCASTKSFLTQNTAVSATQNLKRQVEAKVAAQKEDKLYCVIDLSGGPNAKKYPVSYLDSVPKGGWTDEYKTKKLVLRKIDVGAEPLGRYNVKTEFYMGVFPVTQDQWFCVMGTHPSQQQNALCPVDTVSWTDCRGFGSGKNPRGVPNPSDNSFVGRLVSRTGMMKFDLPTEAQWEYACRAGSKERYFFGSDENLLGEYAWYNKNSGGCSHPVGGKRPNSWGLYDMSGNIWERCLDSLSQEKKMGNDPVGEITGVKCGNRGGHGHDPAHNCTVDYGARTNLTNAWPDRGFRLSFSQDK